LLEANHAKKGFDTLEAHTYDHAGLVPRLSGRPIKRSLRVAVDELRRLVLKDALQAMRSRRPVHVGTGFAVPEAFGFWHFKPHDRSGIVVHPRPVVAVTKQDVTRATVTVGMAAEKALRMYVGFDGLNVGGKSAAAKKRTRKASNMGVSFRASG
jgi:hypothetical protein